MWCYSHGVFGLIYRERQHLKTPSPVYCTTNTRYCYASPQENLCFMYLYLWLLSMCIYVWVWIFVCTWRLMLFSFSSFFFFFLCGCVIMCVLYIQHSKCLWGSMCFDPYGKREEEMAEGKPHYSKWSVECAWFWDYIGPCAWENTKGSFYCQTVERLGKCLAFLVTSS